MRQMFRNIFSAIAVFFGAIERGANTLDSYAKWAEEEAADFELTARLERQARLLEMSAGLKEVL